MPGDDIKMIIEMKEDIAGIKSLLTTMANTNNMAIEALQSARSAHHRIDKIEKQIDDLEKDQTWLPKLITSCVITGIVGGLIGYAVSQMF